MLEWLAILGRDVPFAVVAAANLLSSVSDECSGRKNESTIGPCLFRIADDIVAVWWWATVRTSG